MKFVVTDHSIALKVILRAKSAVVNLQNTSSPPTPLIKYAPRKFILWGRARVGGGGAGPAPERSEGKARPNPSHPAPGPIK